MIEPDELRRLANETSQGWLLRPLRDAADEIERLRADVARWQADWRELIWLFREQADEMEKRECS